MPATRDYPTIEGLVVVFAALFLAVNLVIDVLYTLIDQDAVDMSAAVARRGLVILKSYPLAVVGGAGLAVIAACGGLAGIVAPYNPTAEDLNALLKGPSLRHWMGTDTFGRDVFSLALYGGRPTLLISATTEAVAAELSARYVCLDHEDGFLSEGPTSATSSSTP